MDFVLSNALFSLSLLLGMHLFLEIGRQLGVLQMAKDAEGAQEGIVVIASAVFGLLGLLVAFTFSGATSRFDTGRDARNGDVHDQVHAVGGQLGLTSLPWFASVHFHAFYEFAAQDRFQGQAFGINLANKF